MQRRIVHREAAGSDDQYQQIFWYRVVTVTNNCCIWPLDSYDCSKVAVRGVFVLVPPLRSSFKWQALAAGAGEIQFACRWKLQQRDLVTRESR